MPAGVFDRGGKRSTVTPDEARKQDEEAEAAKKTIYATTVVARRRGEVCFPVTIAFKFEGKPVERQTWDGRDRTRKFRFERPEKLEWVDIDPDRKVLLDVNWANNGRRLVGNRVVSTGWASRWLFLVQHMVTTLGLL